MPPAPMASPLPYRPTDHLANIEGGFFLSALARGFYMETLLPAFSVRYSEW